MRDNKNKHGTAKSDEKDETVMDPIALLQIRPLKEIQLLCSDKESTPENFVNLLRIWMISVMKKKNWSAERWAKEANISGTTITRFVNTNDPNRTPSSKTIDKLARAAGLPAMQEQQQVLIAIIRRSSLLQQVAGPNPKPVDIFSMPSDEFQPALPKYADCRLVEMDNGRFAICRNADPTAGKRVLVMRNQTEPPYIGAYVYAPPFLTSVEKAGHAIPLDMPGVQVLGRMVGEFIDYGDDG